jgi:DDE superfamily endonuclease
MDDDMDDVADDVTDDSTDDDSTIGMIIKEIVDKETELFGTVDKSYYVRTENEIKIADLDDSEETRMLYRFKKNHLQQIATTVWKRFSDHFTGSYERLSLPQRQYVHFETALLLLLYRLAFPTRIYPEMRFKFLMSPSKISESIKVMLFGMYAISQLYLDDISIWIPRLPLYTELISNATYGATFNVFGFIDGTLRRIARPTYNQRQAYSGHKRYHGMKFQSVYGPEGFYLHLYGPLAGCRHDSFLLGESGLLDELQRLFPNGEYSIFGDPAYPNSAWLWGNYRRPRPGVECEFNKTMSSVRECVEWGFKEISCYWKFGELKSLQKIYLSPIGMMYYVSVFLQNLRTTFYGNQTSEYFEKVPMSLEEYLDLLDNSLKNN